MTEREPLAETLMRPTRHLFLSPHYDDVPLSTGGTVRLLAEMGRRPESMVVFGAEPAPQQTFTPFAQALHEAWGLDANVAIASRRAEEATAAAILGAETGVLPFRDAIYRGDAYLSDDDLFGAPAAEESRLAADVVAALNLPDTPNAAIRVYAPLGIGRHVDHQHVFHAGVSLATIGWDVWFYEDIPYALIPDAVNHRFADITTTLLLEQAASVSISETWDAKIDAIMRYSSQLATVFGSYVGIGTSRAAIDSALADYARTVGNGVLAERFWRVSPPIAKKGVDAGRDVR